MPYRSVFREALFEGRSIIVTGGGSGIGRCIAHELSALRATVVLVGRKPEKLAKVEAEIAQEGGTVFALPCDIRDEEAVRATVAAAVAAVGPIHGLVNNAGGQFRAPMSRISAKGWRAVVDTNLTGGFLMARECLNQSMAGQGGGSIVNIIADIWGGMPDMGHSGAARAGMLNFTETAAAEWAPVRVNALAPGWIATSGLDTYPEESADFTRGLARHCPLGRFGLEAEVSAAVTFLLSEGAAFVSGACLRVDGAAPNARRHWEMPERAVAARYEGFHLAVTPKVLEGEG